MCICIYVDVCICTYESKVKSYRPSLRETRGKRPLVSIMVGWCYILEQRWLSVLNNHNLNKDVD